MLSILPVLIQLSKSIWTIFSTLFRRSHACFYSWHPDGHLAIYLSDKTVMLSSQSWQEHIPTCVIQCLNFSIRIIMKSSEFIHRCILISRLGSLILKVNLTDGTDDEGSWKVCIIKVEKGLSHGFVYHLIRKLSTESLHRLLLLILLLISLLITPFWLW